MLDLCRGVGGFALHAAPALGATLGSPPTDSTDGPAPAASAPRVTDVEVSAQAVASARCAGSGVGVGASFEVGDATAYTEQFQTAPGLVVVNPPRRGIRARLAAWLDGG